MPQKKRRFSSHTIDDAMEKLHYSYFNDEVIVTEQTGTYANMEAPIAYKEYGWNHPFAEIFSALIQNGLTIEEFNEFPCSPYNRFNNLEQGGDGMWRIKGMNEKMPVMYSIKAVKK